MDGLSTAEVAEYEALVAKGESGMDELKKFVNDKVFCRQRGEPANFGDGSHYTCPTEGMGGKRKRMRKTKRRLHHKKSKKTKRRSKMGGKSKKRKGKKSRKSKKSRK